MHKDMTPIQNIKIWRLSVEGDKDEKLNDVYFEVVDSPTMTPALLHETEASKAMLSNMDYTMLAEDMILLL